VADTGGKVLVFFEAESLGHDVGQIVIGGNVSEVDYYYTQKTTGSEFGY